MTAEEGMALAETLIAEVAVPLVKAIMATHPDKATAASTLHDLIAMAAAGPDLVTTTEKADDAVADNALDDKFKEVTP